MAKRTNLRGGAPLSILFITIIAFALHSCTVKEMREACPCRVGLDFSQLLSKASGGTVIRTVISDGEGRTRYFREFGTDTCASHYEIVLARGTYTATSLLFDGSESWITDQETIRLKEGAEADSLYGESSFLDARGEEAENIPAALKQFATLFIRFSSPVENLQIEASLNSSCLESRNLAAKASPFALSRTFSGETASIRLPRQCSGEILLSFCEAGTGKPVATLNLSPLLQRINYDFGAPELADIILSMDFGAARATIEVEGWKESFIIVTF